MKIVFLIRHALYLRNFESALRELARRGHEIVLVFSPLSRQVDASLLADLKRDYANIKEEQIAPRTGWWWPASDAFRSFRDYLRYLEPEYDNAPSLVTRGGSRLPPIALFLFQRVPGMKSRPARRLFKRILALIDRSIPPDQGAVNALKGWAPDLLLVTPMIDLTYGQTDYVKAARHLGIPTVLGVASWDNLTNKGIIQVTPDRVLVWNAIQEREAIQMHDIPPDRIRKTGAQLYDHWFEMSPSLDRETFCQQVGQFDPAKPIVLYLCSSIFICRDEVSFVREWLGAVRKSSDPNIRDANVLIRPHPAHGEQWRGVFLENFGRVAIWPAEGAAPIDEERKRSYFDSLYHAGAVVGINTSGFIEAGIVGRRTLTVTTRFRTSQDGTLHFHYLTKGGLLETSTSFEQHFSQLSRALANPTETQQQVRAFIADFVRPAGLDQPGTPVFVQAVEDAKNLTAQPWPIPFYAPIVRAAIWPLARALRPKVLEALGGLHRGVERTKAPRILPPAGRSPRQSFKAVSWHTKSAQAVLAKIAGSDRPIIVGPWLAEIGYELLYWIPMLRWVQDAYQIDPRRFVVISRGGVRSWYGEIAHRYIELFDHFTPAEFMSFNAERQLASNMQKQIQLSEAEERFLRILQSKYDLGEFELMHPELMFSGLFKFHWSQQSSFDHLRHHVRYAPLPVPDAGEIEMRLPRDYYAVRFYARESFLDKPSNRAFARNFIEQLLARSDVVLLDTPFLVDDHHDIDWKERVTNGDGHNHRVISAGDWMVPSNNLEVQSRIIARSRCFTGTYGGLSYLAPFYGRPSISFHDKQGDLNNSHVATATAVFSALDVPFVLLTPESARLISDIS